MGRKKTLLTAVFNFGVCRGEVVAAKGVPTSLSVGQVVWAPESPGGRHKYLVFVGWSERNGFFQNTARKLGIKYCSNRPCALYAAPCPIQGPEPPGNPPATTYVSIHPLTHGPWLCSVVTLMLCCFPFLPAVMVNQAPAVRWRAT